ncbi:MAG TPA: zinc-binding alcohol dehydrogenase [Ktedonobacterales bacterium]|jgi:alcohol dehydrogenase
MKCRSLILTSPRRLKWEETDVAELQNDDVLIQTRFGAISIGTEIPNYMGTARHSKLLTFPIMTGYESLGTVVKFGPAVTHLHPGDRVVAFYGHRTYWVTNADRVIAVPTTISDAQALLVILTCDVAKGIRKLAPTPEQHVVITGAGAIGLLTLALLRAYGVQTIDMVEPLAQRHVKAYQLGAAHVWSPDELAQTEQRYPIGLECSSNNAAFQTLQEHMDAGGRICILADGNLEPLSLTPTFHERELTIVASSDGWDYQAHAAWYFPWVQMAGLPIEILFEETISAETLPETFERLATQSPRPLKVLVDYSSQP